MMVLKVAFIVVSFEVAANIDIEVCYKLRHADKGILFFNACEMPMVAFAAFVVVSPITLTPFIM
ncbi:MAG: hypothetical protein WC156_03645 [Pedobacter sp.]